MQPDSRAAPREAAHRKQSRAGNPRIYPFRIGQAVVPSRRRGLCPVRPPGFCPAPAVPALCLYCVCLLPGKRSPPQILTVPDIPMSPGAADKAGEAASSARSHLHGTKRICGGDRFPGRRHTQYRQGAGQQARDKTREAGRGTGHGGGRGQLRSFPRVCKMFTFCCILFTGRQGKV